MFALMYDCIELIHDMLKLSNYYKILDKARLI